MWVVHTIRMFNLFLYCKKTVRIMTFSKFDEHSSPLFKQLYIIKIFDLILIAIFMMKIHNNLLPSIFNTLFTPVNCVHSYNTRSAAKQSYYIPKIGTNYGLFNIRFQGPKVWNLIEENIKKRSSFSQFKIK